MKLLQKIQLGSLELDNRVVMAPMTRLRSHPDGAPSDLNTQYYTQRSGAGLIISEATAISAGAVGYVNAPGIYTEQHAAGWKNVTDSVHSSGGKIFLQVFHVGRISHSDFLGGKLPSAPSALRANGTIHTPQGKRDFETPRSLELDEIPLLIGEFRAAAQMAKDVGFDGIEIHAANGYLINQFVDDSSNKRKDRYGGSIENRSRFLFEVLEGVLEVWESDRVGIRLSPSGLYNSAGDSNPKSTYANIIENLSQFRLAYLHLMNPLQPIDNHPQMEPDVLGFYGRRYDGNLVMNGGYDKESGNRALLGGVADMVSYGNLFIANPDLPKRFELNAQLNELRSETIYEGDAVGYVDYPSLQ